MAIKCQPLLIPTEYDFYRAPGLTRQASDNCFVAYKGFCSESASHRRGNDTDLILWYVKYASKVHTQVEESLCTGPDFKPTSLPTSYRSVRFHRRMLCASRSKRLFDNDICVLETFIYITMPDAKAMADIRALLRAHAEVGSIIVRDIMMFMDKRSTLRNCLYSIVDSCKFFVLHIDQVDRLLSFPPTRCCNCRHRIASETRAIRGKYRLVLYLTAIHAKLANIVWSEHYNGIWYCRGIHAQNSCMWVTHGFISSRARRTSTAITRRRYSAEPRESDMGSIDSA